MKTSPKLASHPVAKEFHYERNDPLKPEDFTLNSGKKIWWRCSKNSDHEWEARVADRTRERGCPFCVGSRSSKENNLSLNSASKEFHYERNDPLKPEDFTLNSGKKIWWICDKGHEWEAVINSRARGSGCPYCSGNLPSRTNNLSLSPVAKEFHYERNAPLKPEDFTKGSRKKIWWRCSKNPEHEWEARIDSRIRGSGCSFCSGRNPTKTNNLSLYSLSKEFHYERNSPLRPEDYAPHSHQKIWWICDKGHEWETFLYNRTGEDLKQKNNCPTCSHSGTSKAEQEVLDYIKFIYDGEVIHRYKLDGVEADIFIPEKNLAIEHNGLYWHSELYKDKDYHYTKYRHFEEKGIQLYYIWEDQWSFCREEIEFNLKRLIFDNVKIIFKQETCFYTDFRFVSKFRKEGMVELHGYGSWGIEYPDLV